MQKPTKIVLAFAAMSAVLAVASFWWWVRLMAAELPACMAPPVPAGVDCRHDPQFLAGMVFTIACLGLLLSLLVRHVRVRLARRVPDGKWRS